IEPVARRRCSTRYTQARLTSNCAATAATGIPRSHACTTRFRRSNEYAAMAPPVERSTTTTFYVQVQNALDTPFGEEPSGVMQRLHDAERGRHRLWCRHPPIVRNNQRRHAVARRGEGAWRGILERNTSFRGHAEPGRS